MAFVEVSIIPLGTGTPSISKYIAEAVRVLDADSEVKYELTSMGTVIEGDLDHILNLVSKMHKSAFKAGSLRVVTTVKIDERIDKKTNLSNRLNSVKRQLGH